MTSVFGDVQVSIEPWDPDYGPQMIVAPGEDDSTDTADVDPTVEVSADNWGPMAPREYFPSGPIIFVDGVRRIDAYLQVSHESTTAHGAFGSYAAGSVIADGERAGFGPLRLERLVITGSGLSLPSPVSPMPAATYQPKSTAATDLMGVVQSVQREMRKAEEQLARELVDTASALVIIDGPLAFMERGRGAAVGCIKRISNWYLSGRLLDILRSLPVGARTPLFLLHIERRTRYSWFLRIARPWLGDSPTSSLVRMEVSEAVGLEGARRLADGCAVALPRFVPVRGNDPRAPQNLLPIGSLESHLRRVMGDPVLIRRHIETLIRREASRG